MKFYAKYFMSLKDPIDFDNRMFTIQHTQRFFYRIEVHKLPPPPSHVKREISALPILTILCGYIINLFPLII